MTSEVTETKIEDLNKTFDDLSEMNEKDVQKLDEMLSSIKVYK
jgi:hypothetical protein